VLSQREGEHLEFSGRLTEKIGCLQAENSQLSMKVCFASLDILCIVRYSLLLLRVT